MKKKTSLAVLALISLAVVGCGNRESNTTAPATETPTTETGITSTDFYIAEIGTKHVGDTVTLISYFKKSPLTSSAGVVYTCSDSEAMEITGNKALLKKAGTFTINASYTDSGKTYVASTEVIVEEVEAIVYKTVSEVIAMAVKDEYKEVYVRGVITASSGSSGYLQDSTGGIFIYNFYFQSSDTACKSYRWQVGTTVDLHCYVTAYYDVPQLTYSYKDSSGTYHDLEGRYANLAEDADKLEAPEAVEVTEDDIKNFTSASNAGKLYTFEAEYVSGTISATSVSKITFKVGSTEIIMKTDGSSSKAYDKDISEIQTAFNELGLVAGSKVKITAPFNQKYNGLIFSYFSHGSSIEKVVEKDTLYLSYTGTARVGEKLTFSASYNNEAATAVTYTATKGEDLVTISGNEVTLNKAGEVTIQGSYVVGEETKTAEVTFTVLSLDLPEPTKTTIAELNKKTASDTANLYEVTGVIEGMKHDDFGNAYLTDPATGDSIMVYGLTTEKSAITMETTGLTFTNPKTGKTTLADYNDGDTVTIVCVYTYFSGTKTPEILGYATNRVAKDETTKYNITTTNPEHGTVVADKTTASYGETVTLTVTPETNYAVSSVKVENAYGTSKVTKVSDTTYTFTATIVNNVSVVLYDTTAAITSITLTAENLGITGSSKAYTDGTALIDGVSFEWKQFYGAQSYMQSNSSKKSSLTNTTALPSAIDSIVINWASNHTSIKGSAPVSFSTSALTAVDSTTTKKITFATGDTSCTITNDVEGATYFRIDRNDSGAMYWDSLTINLK